MKSRLLLFITAALLTGAPLHAANTWASDGTVTSIQTLHNELAAAGDTITIPAGSYSWTTGVTITKGIILKGAGGGWMKGYSTTSNAIAGSGTKTFTVQAGLGYVVGEAIKAVQKADHDTFMTGTVQSYSSTTLEIAVTSSGGSGTHDEWNFMQEGATIVTHDSGGSGSVMLAVTEHASAYTRIRDIHFKRGAGSTHTNDYLLTVGGSGKPAVVEHCRFTTHTNSTAVMKFNTLHGLIGRCYLDAGSWPWNGSGTGNFTGKAFYMPTVSQATWGEATPHGDNDSTGETMMYIEGNHIHGFFSEMMDVDGGMRVVFRHNVVDHSAVGSHGADTGNHGLRWLEAYGNTFVFDDQSDTHRTPPMNYFIYLRGGTGLFYNNVIPDIYSQDTGDKAEVKLQIQNLTRAGSNSSSFWGEDISGVQYPCPRQVGMGYMTGSGVTLYHPDLTTAIGYAGDPEPIYQWSNTGGGNYASPAIEGYATPTGGQDSAEDYIQVTRDWKNEAHPGWTAYTYPHPLATAVSVPPTASSPRYTPRTARGLGISRRR